MKKRIITVTAVLVLAVSGLALAQMENQPKDMTGGDKGMGMGMMGEKGMMKGDMMDKGGMMGGKMMGGMMMKSMMAKSMVAASDGGVIVLSGNKLTKYDKDLNVVKEVELKMDMEGMHKMMENCPMMKGMMDNARDSQDSQAEPAPPAEAAESSGHEAHH